MADLEQEIGKWQLGIKKLKLWQINGQRLTQIFRIFQGNISKVVNSSGVN